MSVVTAVTLMMSNYELSDDYDISDLPTSPPHLFERVNEWLANNDEAPLQLLGNHRLATREHQGRDERSEGFGGCVRPFVQIGCGGYRNIFKLQTEKERAFQEFVVKLPWRYPELVTLIITHDGDPAVIYRPDCD
jgi:hypothetical protein